MKIWVDLIQFLFAFAISAFAFIKGVQEFFKAQVEKDRLKSIDVGAFKALVQAKDKFEDDIERLKESDDIQRDDIKRVEGEFKDIIKKFMEYQFKKFDDHSK